MIKVYSHIDQYHLTFGDPLAWAPWRTPMLSSRLGGSALTNLPVLAALEACLEAVAERCDDLTPPVYDKFFASHSQARQLFHLDERTRGRMLNEVITILVELAHDHTYMPTTVDALVKDHTSYGEVPLDLYDGLLEALLGVMSDLLGDDWTAAYEAAWRRQSNRLLALVADAMATPVTVQRAETVDA